MYGGDGRGGCRTSKVALSILVIIFNNKKKKNRERESTAKSARVVRALLAYTRVLSTAEIPLFLFFFHRPTPNPNGCALYLRFASPSSVPIAFSACLLIFFFSLPSQCRTRINRVRTLCKRPSRIYTFRLDGSRGKCIFPTSFLVLQIITVICFSLLPWAKS